MKACRLVLILAITLSAANAVALPAASNNDDQPPHFELGVAASGIHLSDNNNFGVGARAVFNFNSFFSLEGEGNCFLNNASQKLFSGGRAIEGLFGPKIGLRTENVGIFAKVRPGVISFSNTVQGIIVNPNVPFSFSIQTGRLTEPALDLGTVIEFYPARHWAWRTDIGDTMVFYRSSNFSGFPIPGATKSNFQFNTGFQYRF